MNVSNMETNYPSNIFEIVNELLKLQLDNFDCVQEMKAQDMSLQYVQESHFTDPVLVKNSPEDLGIYIFQIDTINDVVEKLSPTHRIEITRYSNRQKYELPLLEFMDHYECAENTKNLDVVSTPIEFTDTELEKHILRPRIVRAINWFDCVWPKIIRYGYVIDGEKKINFGEPRYPKVQKFVHIDMKNTFRDFEFSCGGSSQWYHLFKGRKIIWLISPNNATYDLFKEYKQSDIRDVLKFLGNESLECKRLVLNEGDTLFIPSGWIYAEYSTTNCVVFSGKFLHSYQIQMQLNIANLENEMNIPANQRYPYFDEMLWYVIERYVYCDMHLNYFKVKKEFRQRFEKTPMDSTKINVLTRAELNGLEKIISHIKDHTVAMPEIFNEKHDVMKAVIALLNKHKNDNADDLPNGDSTIYAQSTVEPILSKKRKRTCQKEDEDFCRRKTPKENSDTCVAIFKEKLLNGFNKTCEKSKKKMLGLLNAGRKRSHSMSENISPQKLKGNESIEGDDESIEKENVRQELKRINSRKKRRQRCKKCKACLGQDCRDCVYCNDMTKYGGPGKLKQACVKRKCLQPLLTATCVCDLCGRNGKTKEIMNPIMECTNCKAITHKECSYKVAGCAGKINLILPNSWMCSECNKHGRKMKSRNFPALKMAQQMRKSGDTSAFDVTNHLNKTSCANDESTKHIRKPEKKIALDVTADHQNKTNRDENEITDSISLRRTKRRKISVNYDEMLIDDEKEKIKKENERIIRKSIEAGIIDNNFVSGCYVRLDRILISNQSTTKPSSKINDQNYFRINNPVVLLHKIDPCNSASVVKNEPFVDSGYSSHETPVEPTQDSSVRNLEGRCDPCHTAFNTDEICEKIFRYLDHEQLLSCSKVCKKFEINALNKSFWKVLNYTVKHKYDISLIHQINPKVLILDDYPVSRKELKRIIDEVSSIEKLSLKNCLWSSLCQLKMKFTHNLSWLDLSYTDINDSDVRMIFLNEKDIHRQVRCIPKLVNLTTLKLIGCNLTDEVIDSLKEYTTLRHLDLGNCRKITDNAVVKMVTPGPITNMRHLESLCMNSCPLITGSILQYITQFLNIRRFQVNNTSVTESEIIQFIDANSSFNTNNGEIYKK